MPDDDTGLDWLEEFAGGEAETAMRAAMDHPEMAISVLASRF
ncbi:MAG: hypothetical protein OXP75_09825 [Rhodospirillales bacterium]|nr:hypothetical protein [Rhodospirillales bacterium]